MNKRRIIQLIVLVAIIIIPLFFLVLYPMSLDIGGPAEIDKIRTGPYAGNYLVTDGRGAIVIVDFVTHEILWKTELPEFFVHDADMMPDGKSILVADTGADRVFQMNLSNKVILWNWYAKNNTHDIYMDYNNWTAFGLQHGWSEAALAKVQNFHPPLGPEHWYTHLNTVQFLNGSDFGRGYDSVLMSLRNFDMVIEVNYTAQKGEPGYRNITWFFGAPLNHDILYHQHAPKRWANGHTTICDSEKSRVIEIDENNTIVWEYTDKKLRWPRDCELLPNGNYLITDSCNNRIFEVNMTTQTIIRTFTDPRLNVPYEADYVDEDKHVLGGSNQIIIIFDYETGAPVGEIGQQWFHISFYLIFSIFIAYSAIDGILEFRGMKEKSIKQRFRSPKIYKKLILVGILVMVIIFWNYIFAFLWYHGLF